MVVRNSIVDDMPHCDKFNDRTAHRPSHLQSRSIWPIFLAFVLPGSALVLTFHPASDFRPRFVGGHGAIMESWRVSDACSIARSEARTIGRVFRYPAEPI